MTTQALPRSGSLRDGYAGGVLWLATLASVASFGYFYARDLTTAFSDAESRLMIARSVVDGLHSGLAQLGGVWLPLPQAAMLPFIWNTSLYTSGVAGSLVSMASYIVAAAFLYRLLLVTTRDRPASLIGAVAFSSPSILYMQSTPMSEMLFICLFVATFYFLMRWLQDPDELAFLFITALTVFLATLTRYEGWVLLGVVTLVVLYTCRVHRFGYTKTEGHLVFFGTLGVFGVGLWLLWNQVIFGDLLYFYRSEYSPAGLIRQWQPAGTLVEEVRTTGNLALSIQIYGRTALDSAGWVTAFLAVLGLIRLVFSRGASDRKVLGLALLFPLPFYVLSLVEGRNVLIMEHPSITGGYLNLRYGAMMLPAVGFFVAHLARDTWTWTKPVLFGLVVASTVVTWQGGIIALSEAVDNRMNFDAQGQIVAGRWLSANYDGGLIMIQRSTSEHATFASRLPLSSFIYEGDQQLWQDALRNPAAHARWIFMRKDSRDRLWVGLAGTPQITDNYVIAYRNATVDIYRLESR